MTTLVPKFEQPYSNAVNRPINLKLQDIITPEDFGAIGDGTTNDTTAMQNAINCAVANGKALYLRNNFYSCGALTISGRITMYGDGMFSCGIISSVTGTTDAITINPPTNNTGNTGYLFRDFGVKPATAGNGRNGIHIPLATNAYFSNSEIERIYIGDFGALGLSLDNSVQNQDGFYTLTIRRCWIQNGIAATYIGDSITISENTITGTRLTTPGIVASSLSGARQIVIKENNITTQAGGLALISIGQVTVRNNQIEHPAYAGNYTGTYNAQVYLYYVTESNIIGNTISTGASTITAATYGLLLDSNCSYNTISQNNIFKGSVTTVGLGASSTFNILKYDNSFDTNPPVIYNAGVNNAGIIDIPLTLQNSWVNYATDTTPSVSRTESGVIMISGEIAGGTITQGTVIATLPTGFAPTRQKRFQVTNFNGSAFSSATLLVSTNGNISILSITSNTLLGLDGIQYTLL